ncbi:tRNA lysidine(34) synthetase TilS [soil metagenome]
MLSVERFREFLFSSCAYTAGEPVLAAVSGGVDSVVLCDLLLKNKIEFAIAHVNYRLRGNESDEDEQFVAALAKKLNVPFYLECCNEETFSATGENSIQAAARKIRYAFFEKSCREHGYSKVATAHHKDDSIETALLNFARGTGVKGLTGIAPVKGNLIRPMLFTSRDKIVMYANAAQLLWREDSSNETDKYSRNRFRHHLLPWLMNEIPQAYNGFEASFNRLAESEKLIIAAMENWKTSCCTGVNTDETKISLIAISKFQDAEIYLRFFLRKNGFPEFHATSLTHILNGDSGAELISSTHRLIRDRDFLFLVKKNETPTSLTDAFSFFPDEIPAEIPNEKWSALIDSSLITLPLTLRTWKEGDTLIPFGMSGHKNVSDILNEMKLPTHKKENAPVILSGNEIVWIPGYRIADKFRITKKTTSVIRLKFNPNNYGD